MNEVFKALADPTRREILNLLQKDNATAGEIHSHFDISKPSISHHLSILRNAGLIEKERKGQHIVYSLDTTVFQDVTRWLMGFQDNKNQGS